MRLDSMGKPPLLQLVREPQETKANGKASPPREVKQPTETPEQSNNSHEQSKLGHILELLAKNKRKNGKKSVAWAAVQYSRASTYKEKKRVGESLDVSG